MQKHSCGGCQDWIPVIFSSNGKLDRKFSTKGLCLLFDGRIRSDWGHSCPFFRALKYDRKKFKRETEDEINNVKN